MGKKKAQNNSGTKPKQDTPTTITEITEPFQTPTTSPGDIKLQRQRERQEREAKEEAERKKAEIEKEKQEAKKAKKKNNKSSTKQKSTSPVKVERELKNVSHTISQSNSVPAQNVAASSHGVWEVHDTKPDSVKLNTDTTVENWDTEMTTDIENKPPPQFNSVKLDRNFNNDGNLLNKSKQPFRSSNDAWGGSQNQQRSTNEDWDLEGSENQQYDSKNQQTSSNDDWEEPKDQQSSSNDERASSKYQQIASNNDWRNNRSENSRVGAPRYNSRDNYNNKYSNKSSNWNQQSSRNNDYGIYDNGKNDTDFQEFLALSKQRNEINHNKLKEIKGDLFTASEEYSLAHCVAEDMSMGAGIAKTFRTKFGRVGHLLNQRAKTGGLALLIEETRYIYYLVTKHVSRGKPTYYTLWLSLHKMRDHIYEKKVTKLAIPQIGCGLDRLEWSTVSQMMEHVFRDIDIEIVVYIWDESLEEANPKKLMKKCVVVHEEKKLLEIQSDTGLLYFGSADGYETEEFKYLAKEFNLVSYKGNKKVTDILKCTERKDYYVYGCIIRDRHNDPPDYEVIEKTIKELKKMLKQDGTYYVAFQAFIDEADKKLQEKLISLMQYIFMDVEIYICWQDHLKDKCPQQRRSYY